MALQFRTILIWGTGALFAGGLAFLAFRTEPVLVDLAEVQRGSMEVTVNADGKTRIREVYEVAAPVTGTVRRLPVRVGDQVTGGETVVAIVEPGLSDLLDARTRIQAEAAVREAQAALRQAQSRLREVEEDRALAEREFERARALVERGVSPLTRFETAQQTLGMKKAAEDAALSGLEMQKNALDRARAALLDPLAAGNQGEGACCIEVKAPVTGHVLDIDILSERPVAAGTALLSVGRRQDLEIVADILSEDAARLATGAATYIERWGGDKRLEARLTKIEPSAYTKVSALGIEEQRVDIVFDFVSEKDLRSSLGDGYSVFLRIVEWEEDDVLMVPVSAIFRHSGEWAVFVEVSGEANLRPLKIGRRNGSHAQVLTGLQEGERVIAHPSDEIAEGTAIRQR